MVLQDNTSAAATVAPATITVDNLLNAAEAVRAVEVRISLSEGDTIDSAKIGDTDLTVTDGAYSFDATELDDGTYTITVVTQDIDGNQSTATQTVTIDKTVVAPTVALATDSGTAGDDEITNDATLSLTGVETGATVEYQVGNGEWSTDYDPTTLADGEHTVRVRVTDAAGNVSEVSAITFTLDTTAPEDILRSGGLVAEKAAVGKEFATLSAVDDDEGDTFTYTLVTDESGETPAQNEFFEIAGNKIRVKAALNDAQVGLQELWVKVTDAAGHSYVESVTIGVYNTEEAPENVALLNQTAVDELAANGTVVGTLSATDQDNGDHVAFRLVDDAGGRFEVANGQIVVKNGLKLDYEQARTHKVTVEAKDNEGLVTLKTFTINLANVDPEVVNGTAASETFFGGAGRDVLNGGAGSDILAGGLGNDVLTGGDGKDSFVFNTALNGTKNVDTIKSFSVKDDTIRLENAIFKKLTKTGTLSKDSFIVGDKAKDSKDYVVYNKKTGALSYDADGSGRGAAIKIAQLDKDLAMTAADFFVI